MELPTHISDRIREIVNEATNCGATIDEEARTHGAVALLGTIGSIWLLRPDGTLWDVDADTGKPLMPLPPEQRTMAIVAGTERYPWLAELLPKRPSDAKACSNCRGQGVMRPPGETTGGIFCSTCDALGWVCNDA